MASASVLTQPSRQPSRSRDGDFPHVEGVDAFWASVRGRGAPMERGHVRLMLDTLGLGTEQAYRRVGACADPAAFRAWIAQTVAAPDPVALARYHAVLAGAPTPPAVQARIAAIEAAAPVLDAAALARWDALGHVVVPAAIGADEAAAAAAPLWEALGARADDPDSWYRATGGGLWVPVVQHPALDVARRSPRVHKAFAQLWGTADLWMTVDQMSFNPPERPDRPFQGAPLHWDVSLAPPIPFATQAILYLTDTAADQGALRLVPGFHHRIDAWLAALGDADPRGIDLTDQAVPVPAGAGDLVIWRQDLPHGASPNRARLPRLAQYLTMYPAGLKQNPVWR